MSPLTVSLFHIEGTLGIKGKSQQAGRVHLQLAGTLQVGDLHLLAGSLLPSVHTHQRPVCTHVGLLEPTYTTLLVAGMGTCKAVSFQIKEKQVTTVTGWPHPIGRR